MSCDTVLELVCDLLPRNIIAVSLRRLNRALHSRYVNSTRVDCKQWLPCWALEERWEALQHSKQPSKQRDLTAFFNGVVESGDLGNVQRLMQQGGAWDACSYVAAARGGHVHMLQWAVHNGCPTSPDLSSSWSWWKRVIDYLHAPCTQAAASHGHLHVLEWLDGKGWLLTNSLWVAAARAGQLPVLRWVRTHGYPLPRYAHVCSTAAGAGHLAALQWLRAEGCPWDDYVCSCAAYGGYLDLLQWARANGCPWDAETCYAAAGSGHLELLLWARDNGCPCALDERFAAVAAANRHLHLLQWARSQEPPCRWDADVTFWGAINGHVELLQWALDNGCPWDRRTYQHVLQRGLPVQLPGLRRSARLLGAG